MPLVWERAFGGSDQTEKGIVAEPRNPVGTGFRASNSLQPLGGFPLPNIEDPTAPISGWKDTPPPAGFGPVGGHWLPRASFAGTYDTEWQNNRAPFLPNDFDPRYCQIAPFGLVTPTHLVGGELVELRGASPSGVMRFTLPTVGVRATYRVDSSSEVRAALLDTVIIEPDSGHLTMVWRAALACDKKALKVREVMTHLVEPVQVAAA
jgi:hypothetical protein